MHVARVLRADGATYRAVEWHGVEFLSVGDRMTLATLSIEVGGKAGIVPPTGNIPDDIEVPSWLFVDPDAHYEQTLDVDLNALTPQVAMPELCR